MKDEKPQIIHDYDELRNLALSAINDYIALSTMTKFAISTKVFLLGIDSKREGFYHGSTGKHRAIKLKAYLEKVKGIDHEALLVLFLALFSPSGTKGQSSKLASLIADQWIYGDHNFIPSLGSSVFLQRAISDAIEDDDNFTQTSGEFNDTSFDKPKSVRALLQRTLNQPEFKTNLASLQVAINLIRKTLDNRHIPLYPAILPKSAAIEKSYAQNSLALALSGTRLPTDTLCKIGLFFSRIELARGVSRVNRATFYGLQETLQGRSFII